MVFAQGVPRPTVRTGTTPGKVGGRACLSQTSGTELQTDRADAFDTGCITGEIVMARFIILKRMNLRMGRSYSCKVCRVLDERDLDHYDERLLSEWRGDERKGYRQLSRWLNVTLLRREMDRAGLSTLGNEAESKYERLTEGGATADEVTDILQREGIAIEKLRNDFVSYGVIRTHITDCLGAEYEPRESTDWERDAIEIARSHAHDKIESAVKSMLNKEKLSATGDVTINLDVELECEECQTRVPLRRAQRRGTICACAGMNEPSLDSSSS